MAATALVALASGPAAAGTVAIVDGAQFGTALYDGVFAVAADSSGTYFGGERRYSNADRADAAFLRRVRPDGTTAWEHRIKTSGYEYFTDVVTTSNAVYGVGATTGLISAPADPERPTFDGFVVKLRKSDGMRLWSRQIGSAAVGQELQAAAIDDTGLYVAGIAYDALSGCTPDPCTHVGDADAFVRKYTVGGSPVWTRQFGTTPFDYVDGITASSGGVFVAGLTGGVMQPGHVMTGTTEVFVRRFSPGGTATWTRQFGPTGLSVASVGQVDANAHGVYVAGSADAPLDGTTYVNQGDSDVFVRMYSFSGGLVDTKQFGSAGDDDAHALAASGSSVVVGGDTNGNLFGANAGGFDMWARAFTSSAGGLASDWKKHVGTADNETPWALDVVARGVYLGGDTNGVLPGCSPACQARGEYDAFWLQLD